MSPVPTSIPLFSSAISDIQTLSYRVLVPTATSRPIIFFPTPSAVANRDLANMCLFLPFMYLKKKRDQAAGEKAEGRPVPHPRQDGKKSRTSVSVPHEHEMGRVSPVRNS